MDQTRVGRFSRFTLGSIRLVNGVAALGAPVLVARRLGVQTDRGVLYVLRLFGVRTVLLGAELLFLRGERLERSVRMAPIIHASDTASALISGFHGDLPRRAAVLTVLISATNTVLALLAQDYRRRGQHTNGSDTTGELHRLVAKERDLSETKRELLNKEGARA